MIVAGTRVPYPVRSITAVLHGLSIAVLRGLYTAVLRGLSLAVRRGHILVLVLVYFVPLLPFLVNSTMQQGLK